MKPIKKKKRTKKKLGLFDTLAKTNPMEVAMIRAGGDYRIFKV
jgi:hypothetical protein